MIAGLGRLLFHAGVRAGLDLDAFPNIRRWYDSLKTRPGLRRGYDVGKDLRAAVFSKDGPDDETRRTLFRQKVD